jgi:uncharacterized protein
MRYLLPKNILQKAIINQQNNFVQKKLFNSGFFGMGISFFSVLLVFSLFSASLSAKELPPKSNKLVNDYAGILTAEQRQKLENKLVAFDDSTSTQIAIVIEKTLEDEDIDDYSVRLAEAWQIGRKGKNNGVLIYMAVDDHNLAIEVGYGLEPVITDIATAKIRADEMNPRFREGQYYEGLDKATDVLMALASKEFSASEYAGNKKEPEGKGVSITTIIVIIIIIIILSKIFGGGNKGNRRRGGWGDFTSGRGPFFPPFGGGGGFGGGGFGGGGGGGFGGFGGGSFGGGGSSGKW